MATHDDPPAAAGVAARPKRYGELWVYFAGKIGGDDWRHPLVPGLASVVAGGDGEPAETVVWEERQAPGRRVVYAGPFYRALDHHGHGHGGDGDRVAVAGGCLRLLERADVVFAWLDDVSAHGTLVELGYALALAQRRSRPLPIYLYRPEGPAHAAWVAEGCPAGGHASVLALQEALSGEFPAPGRDELWFVEAAVEGSPEGRTDVAVDAGAAWSAFLLEWAHLHPAPAPVRVELTSRCRECGAPIGFRKTDSGRWQPVDADGTVHFGTCRARR